MSDRTEIRIAVNRKFIEKLEDRTGVTSGTEVVRTALCLLSWAADEASRGRVILSTSKNGYDLHKLCMSELEYAKG